MAATAMLNLYTSWDQFDRNDHITFDEDRSVRMSALKIFLTRYDSVLSRHSGNYPSALTRTER